MLGLRAKCKHLIQIELDAFYIKKGGVILKIPSFFYI